LFALVQAINITAIITTIFLARRGNQICPYHFDTAWTRQASALTLERQRVYTQSPSPVLTNKENQ
jgi:hypothetical protein